MQFRWPRRRLPCQASFCAADLVELFFESEMTQRLEWETGKQRDTPIKLCVRLQERFALLLVRSLDGCRIMHAPMRGHRLPGPDRARFRRRLIADRKHKVHKWRLGSGELVPVLTA